MSKINLNDDLNLQKIAIKIYYSHVATQKKAKSSRSSQLRKSKTGGKQRETRVGSGAVRIGPTPFPDRRS